MNIAVFLDEVLPINGPLMFIPKSHKYGTLAAGHDTSTTSYPLWTLDNATVTRLAAEAAGSAGLGIVAPTGKPGSVIMFHGNLVHASPPNITPYPRKIVYLTLCAVSNHITKFTRAEWIAHRDFTPIEPVNDDALLPAPARALPRNDLLSGAFRPNICLKFAAAATHALCCEQCHIRALQSPDFICPIAFTRSMLPGEGRCTRSIRCSGRAIATRCGSRWPQLGIPYRLQKSTFSRAKATRRNFLR